MKAPDPALPTSTFVLGCGGFGGVGSAREHWTRRDSGHQSLLDAALDRGICWFDTANSYGDGFSEQVLGDWLRAKGSATRDRLVVCTKVGQPTGRHDPARARHGLLSRREIETSAEESMRRLGVDVIDVYLAHHLDSSTSIEELVETMAALVLAGKVRHWGLCNVPAWLVVECAHVCRARGLAAPQVVQNGFSLLQQGDTRDFGVVSPRYRLRYTPHSPLAGGWLTGRYRGPAGSYPAGSRMALRPGPYTHLETPQTRARVTELTRIAADHGVEPATLAVAWILSQNFVAAPIIGPDDVAQLGSTMAAAEVALDPTEADRLTDLFGGPGHTSSFTGMPRP